MSLLSLFLLPVQERTSRRGCSANWREDSLWHCVAMGRARHLSLRDVQTRCVEPSTLLLVASCVELALVVPVNWSTSTGRYSPSVHASGGVRSYYLLCVWALGFR